MKISLKSRLEPNNKQLGQLLSNSGAYRFAWNWALGKIKDEIDATPLDEKVKLTSCLSLKKQFNHTYKKYSDWTYECSKCSFECAFANLDKALKRFWNYKKTNKGTKLRLDKIYKGKVLKKFGKTFGIKKEWQDTKIPLYHQCFFPNFKMKGNDTGFELTGSLKVTGRYIKLPTFDTPIKMSEDFGQHLPKSVRISFDGMHFHTSFPVDVELETIVKPKNKSVGVDLGISTFVTCSDDTEIHIPKISIAKVRRTAHFKRLIQRKRDKNPDWKTSKLYKAIKLKALKAERKITNIRKDITNKTTTKLAKEHSVVTIEDLNVKGMMANHKLAKAIQHKNFYEFRRQLEYKANLYGCQIVIANRFFPSTKMCRNCNTIHKQLKLSDRIYSCPACKYTQARDKMAACNLDDYGRYAVGLTVNMLLDTALMDDRR
jgi:putative transposase